MRVHTYFLLIEITSREDGDSHQTNSVTDTSKTKIFSLNGSENLKNIKNISNYT